jgi:hypothetical protein
MEVPDRDKLIYTQKRAAVEHLLPPPEKPMARPSASVPAQINPQETLAPAPGQSVAGQQSMAKPGVKPVPASAPAGPAKPAAGQEAPANARGARLQLGSVRSDAAARQEWDRIRRSNPDLLASVLAVPVRADLGDKGVFYRIETAPLASADRICAELKRRNIGCIIAK